MIGAGLLASHAGALGVGWAVARKLSRAEARIAALQNELQAKRITDLEEQLTRHEETEADAWKDRTAQEEAEELALDGDPDGAAGLLLGGAGGDEGEAPDPPGGPSA